MPLADPHLSRFLAECTAPADSDASRTSSARPWSAWSAWSARNGFRVSTRHKLGCRMTDLGYRHEHGREGSFYPVRIIGEAPALAPP